MALLVADSTLGSQAQQRAVQLEERFVARVFQLITSILRLGVTQAADCYDPQVIEKHMP
jgi:hypothetical protein